MLTVLLDYEGISFMVFLPKDTTIDAEYYLIKKRPEKLHRCLLLQQNNARPYTARKTKEILNDL